MYLGKHKIKTKKQTFDITTDELHILDSPEAKTWFSITKKDTKPKTKSEK